MLIKNITYTDYDGNERNETFYFNLSKAELMELEMSIDGGWAERIQQIVNAKDVPTLSKIFKDLILRSYGEKSPDGKRFVKSAALSEAFTQTEAYSELFMELITDPDSAAAFMNGILPAIQETPATIAEK